MAAGAGGAFHQCVYCMAALCKCVGDVQGAAFGLHQAPGSPWADSERQLRCSWSSVLPCAHNA